MLTERLENCIRKIKKIKDSSDLDDMYVKVNQMITSAEAKAINQVAYVSYVCNGVEMYYLRSLLKVMREADIKYDECLLPGKDVKLTKPSEWVWELYSDKQKINRISKFFYFHQLSYIEMIQANFPLLQHKFSRCLDAPYQTIVLLHLNKSKDKYSQPSMIYYTKASSSDLIELPEIRVFDNDQERIDYCKEIYNEIRQSYLSQGREAHRLGYSQTGFTFTTSSRLNSCDSPLSDYVYDSIKSSLEEVFGNL